MSLAGARTWLQSKGLGDKQEFDSPSEALDALLCLLLSFFFSFFMYFFCIPFCFSQVSSALLSSLLCVSWLWFLFSTPCLTTHLSSSLLIPIYDHEHVSIKSLFISQLSGGRCPGHKMEDQGVEEILHQGFNPPFWCRNSSIHRSYDPYTLYSD